MVMPERTQLGISEKRAAGETLCTEDCPAEGAEWC
jgi:hypothetical protein